MKMIQFCPRVKIKVIAKHTPEELSGLYYNDHEIAEFRQRAFMIECGLVISDDEDDEADEADSIDSFEGNRCSQEEGCCLSDTKCQDGDDKDEEEESLNSLSESTIIINEVIQKIPPAASSTMFPLSSPSISLCSDGGDSIEESFPASRDQNSAASRKQLTLLPSLRRPALEKAQNPMLLTLNKHSFFQSPKTIPPANRKKKKSHASGYVPFRPSLDGAKVAKNEVAHESKATHDEERAKGEVAAVDSKVDIPMKDTKTGVETNSAKPGQSKTRRSSSSNVSCKVSNKRVKSKSLSQLTTTSSVNEPKLDPKSKDDSAVDAYSKMKSSKQRKVQFRESSNRVVNIDATIECILNKSPVRCPKVESKSLPSMPVLDVHERNMNPRDPQLRRSLSTLVHRPTHVWESNTSSECSQSEESLVSPSDKPGKARHRLIQSKSKYRKKLMSTSVSNILDEKCSNLRSLSSQRFGDSLSYLSNITPPDSDNDANTTVDRTASRNTKGSTRRKRVKSKSMPKISEERIPGNEKKISGSKENGCSFPIHSNHAEVADCAAKQGEESASANIKRSSTCLVNKTGFSSPYSRVKVRSKASLSNSSSTTKSASWPKTVGKRKSKSKSLPNLMETIESKHKPSRFHNLLADLAQYSSCQINIDEDDRNGTLPSETLHSKNYTTTTTPSTSNHHSNESCGIEFLEEASEHAIKSLDFATQHLLKGVSYRLRQQQYNDGYRTSPLVSHPKVS